MEVLLGNYAKELPEHRAFLGPVQQNASGMSKAIWYWEKAKKNRNMLMEWILETLSSLG